LACRVKTKAEVRRLETAGSLFNTPTKFWDNVVVSRDAGPEPIRIFVTGGTFDKEYDELTGHLYFKDSHLPEMLKLGRCNLRLELRTLMMIDSLDMTDADRNLILEQCRQAPEGRIVITHGTDTMVETAQALAANITGKTIVLTGAMVPYKFGSSDGLFNLGSALGFAQTLPPGVYVAMNGRYFRADGVHKNRQTGMFEEQPAS
jgi:L-asparaginase